VRSWSLTPQATTTNRAGPTKAICETRIRYGYRRVDVLLRREGWHVNQKRIRRIYNELGLQLRNKTRKLSLGVEFSVKVGAENSLSGVLA
jgi:transposase InsO family protein